MPFPKTWVEELIIEWLHLEGFLVEANFPVGVAKLGGRLEVDVVGAKISNGVLEIIHVETGQLSAGQKGIDFVKKKFSKKVCNSVSNYFKQGFSFTSGNIDYRKMYVPTYWTKPTIKGFENSGIEIETLPDFISNNVLRTINRWKQNPLHQPQIRGKSVTLPESYWILQLVDYLNAKRMLKCTGD